MFTIFTFRKTFSYFIALLLNAPFAADASEVSKIEMLPLESPDNGEKPNVDITLTLEKCIELVFANSSKILHAQMDLKISEANVIEGRGRFWPTLELNSVPNVEWAAYLDYIVEESRSVRYMYGIDSSLLANLNIFDGYRDIALARAAREGETAARLQLKKAKQDAVSDIIDSYLRVVLTFRLIGLAEKNLATSKALLAQITHQAKAGLKKPADVALETSQFNADQFALSEALNRNHQAKIDLIRKLRLDMNHRYRFLIPQIDKEPDEAGDDEYSSIQAALAQRPDAQAKSYLRSKSDWEVKAAKSGSYPTIDLTVGMYSNAKWVDWSTTETKIDGHKSARPEYQNSIPEQVGSNLNYAVFLTLKWNIFDRRVTSANVQRATVNSANAGLVLEGVRDQITQEVRQAHGELAIAKQELEIAGEIYKGSSKAFDEINDRFNAGTASLLEWSDARTELIISETTSLQARIKYYSLKKTFRTVIGTMPVD